MIAFRAAGSDSNTNGVSSAFVGIPKPSGVQDGDTLIVAIALPLAHITVTPPDSTWTEIEQTDPSRTIGIVAFWKVAINEPTNWVFALSTTAQATGTVVAYVGTDAYNAIEAVAPKLSASGTSHAVAPITASEGSEEYLLFLAGKDSGTYTVTADFQRKASKVQTGIVALELWQKQSPLAQTYAGFNATFSLTATGASLAIIIRPGFGTLALDDVRRRLVGALPDGAADVYDLEPGGDYYKFYQAMAQTFKIFGFDEIDLLRREIVPALSRYKLPDWERIFGLETTLIAQTGTIPQRQARVIAAWRAAAGEGSSLPAIAAALGPVLGYFPATTVQIIETSRLLLTAHHSYDMGSVTIPASPATVTATFTVPDGGVVSSGGAHVDFGSITAPLDQISVIMTGPDADGNAVDPLTHVHVPGDGIAYGSWAAGAFGTGSGPATVTLFAPDAAGCYIAGVWSVMTRSAAAGGTVTQVILFTEGIGPNQNTGGAIFNWGVYADPAHMGENGYNADLALARQIIQKMAPAHTVGNLIQSLDPHPDVDAGIHAAIPDECLPV